MRDKVDDYLWDLAAIASLAVALTVCLYWNKKGHDKFVAKTETAIKNKFSKEKEKIISDIKNENPTASFVKAKAQNGHIEKYAERKTDSAKIKSIKEKYLFKLTQFEQAKQKLQEMRQPLNDSLIQAAAKGNYIGVLKALERGADVNYQDPETGNTALMMALEKCPVAGKGIKIAEYLFCEPGFSLDITNKSGISQKKLIRDKQMNCYKGYRDRSHSEVAQLAEQVKNLYQELDNTYGKEMREALGYEYKEYEYFNFSESDDKVHYHTDMDKSQILEILHNEDGTRDTTEIGYERHQSGYYGVHRHGRYRHRGYEASGPTVVTRPENKYPTQKSKLKLSMNPEIDSR